MTTHASRSHLAAALALTCLSALTAQPARADRVIGPGQEDHVLSLFAPAGLGDEVVTGYRLMDVSIRSREILLRLDPTSVPGAAPRPLQVRLVALDEPLDGAVAFADSESFALVTDAQPSDSERAALEQLVTRVRENDDGSFWVEVATENGASEGMGSAALPYLAALAAVVAVVVVTVVVRRKRKRSSAVE
ncbi:MAG: hypothetical protein IPI43_31020 [Sandaracinaceae bacterium]|nr:hypothetical protein [Sandaracinaceae bacterium]MBK7778495.1 hypothetical protein [Sandaracinaceae bacterium]